MTSCIIEEKRARQASICSFFGVIKRKQVKDSSSTTAASTKKRQKLEQMYLDLGQRDFGKHIHCHTCGMMYVHGVEEDLAAHAKICDDFQHGVRLIVTPSMRKLRKINADECIIEIRPNDNRTLQTKLGAILDVVKRELSFVTFYDRSSESTLTQQQSAFLYVVKNRVVGLVIAETIEEAFLFNGDEHSERTDAWMGIFQLWVHSKFRRKGLASRLVTAAREHMVFGMVVPVKKIAFSSPTKSGMAFAQRYVAQLKVDQVLVYNCSSIES